MAAFRKVRDGRRRPKDHCLSRKALKFARLLLEFAQVVAVLAQCQYLCTVPMAPLPLKDRRQTWGLWHRPVITVADDPGN